MVCCRLVLDSIVHVKGVKELHENVVLSSLSSFDIGMLRGVVAALDVIDVNSSATVSVELLKSRSDQLFSELAHFSYYCSEKFIKVNSTVSIDVKGVEESLCVLFSHPYSEIIEAFPELDPAEGL